MEFDPAILYEIERSGNKAEFRPSAMFSKVMVGSFAGGSAFSAFVALLLALRNRSGSLGFVAIFCGAAIFCAYLALRAWRTRATALCIESNGRVSYGDQELCGAGSVSGVHVRPVDHGEGKEFAVVLQTVQCEFVSIPSQYFPNTSSPEVALALAKALAEELRVAVHRGWLGRCVR